MNKRWGCVGIVLLVLLGLSVLFNFFLLRFVGSSNAVTNRELPHFGEQLIVAGTNQNPDKIAVINLRGLIATSVQGSEGETMVDDIKIALQQALDDSKVKAIVLNVDSPGGEVTASDVIYNAVRTARAKKPVVIYMGSVAASGAYYVSCGGSYLMANDTSLTASIGVIIESANFSQLLGKIGVAPVVIKSGSFKDMLSPTREMTDAEKVYIQGLVNETYEQFLNVVATERHLKADDAFRTTIADGRVITGKDALADKLIDGLGQIEDAYAKARELGNAPGAEVVLYKPQGGLGKLFKLLGESNESSQAQVEINLTQKAMPPLEPGKLYMLPDFYAQ